MRPDFTLTPEASLFVSAASLRRRLDWFHRLRWGAVVALAVVTAGLQALAGIPLPVGAMLGATAALCLMNLGYVVHNRMVAPHTIRAEIRVVKLEMAGDLFILTIVLNLTGGIENPFLHIYVLHVVLAALLFKGREIFSIAWLAIILFTAEVLGEYVGWLPHHHLLGSSAMTHDPRYILASLGAFWLVMLGGAFVSASVMRHNRTIKDELVARQRALLAADQAMIDFFRFVTHEVKTPVNTARSAIAAVVSLSDSGLDASSRDLLGRALKRLDQTNEIVKDLADLTRTGVLQSDAARPVDLGAIAARVVEDQREAAAATGQVLKLRVLPTPLIMSTVGPLFEKIVGNLLSNAIRYNRDGGRVDIEVAAHDGGVRLVVADQGIGIAPVDHERVFEEFYRTADAQRKNSLGTGLGLPIVRRFAAELGGSVSLTSAVGKGTTVTVQLPPIHEINEVHT